MAGPFPLSETVIRRVTQQIDSAQDDILAFLANLVRFRTPSQDSAGPAAAGTAG